MREKTTGGSARYARELTAARKKLGLSQGDMGKLLGMSQAAVSHIENRTNPLSPLQHLRLQQALAQAGALRLLEGSGALAADYLSGMSPDAFLGHLGTCAPCLARAAWPALRGCT